MYFDDERVLIDRPREIPVYLVIATDDKGAMRAIGGFTTEDRAKTWWSDHQGDENGWEFVGTARQNSCVRILSEWGYAARSLPARHKASHQVSDGLR